MADTEDLAPARAAATPTTPRRATTTTGVRRGRGRPRASDDLESQVAQLQSDLKSITLSLQRLGEEKVGEARHTARIRAAELRDKGEELLESAQDEFGAVEKQIKDTIREKPLTAVAGALALGFILAVITR